MGDDETAVLAANAAFYDAFNAHDVEAMEEIWARTVPITCAHPQQSAIEGLEAVMASWAAILGNEEQARVVGNAERALVVGDLGLVAGREFVAGVPIVVTNVFLREDGDWRICHHHAGPVFDAAAP